MKLFYSSLVVLLVGCQAAQVPASPQVSGVEPTPEFQPALETPVRLVALPGDVVSWLQENPPRFSFEVRNIDDTNGADILAKLTQGTVIDVQGKPVATKNSIVGWPLEPSSEGQGVVWPRIVARATQTLPSGWNTVSIDVSAFGDTIALDPGLRAQNGKLVTRFNISSAPTVRRVTLWQNSGDVRVQFSEPITMVGAAASTVVLTDYKGNPLTCAKGLSGAQLSADRETLAFVCETALPPELSLSLDPAGFNGQTRRQRLTDLTGAPFATTIALGKNTTTTLDGECAVWLP